MEANMRSCEYENLQEHDPENMEQRMSRMRFLEEVGTLDGRFRLEMELFHKEKADFLDYDCQLSQQIAQVVDETNQMLNLKHELELIQDRQWVQIQQMEQDDERWCGEQTQQRAQLDSMLQQRKQLDLDMCDVVHKMHVFSQQWTVESLERPKNYSEEARDALLKNVAQLRHSVQAMGAEVAGRVAGLPGYCAQETETRDQLRQVSAQLEREYADAERRTQALSARVRAARERAAGLRAQLRDARQDSATAPCWGDLQR